MRTAVVRSAAAELVLLDLSIEADVDGLIRAERDAFDPSVEITLAGTGLAAAALDDRTAALMPTTARQQLLFLPGGEFTEHDPDALPDEVAATLRQLLIKDTDIGYRPSQMAVRVPPDINGPDRQAVFVWATNTVAAGLDAYGELGRLRELGLVLSNCQALAADMTCRAIRAAALAELDEPAPAADQPAEALRERADRRIREVARLRHELSRDAGIAAQGSAVAGGRPLVSYHRAVIAESELPALLAVTEHLLEQLAAALTVEHQLRDVQEARETAAQQLAVARSTQGLLNQSEALKSASVVFASVAAVLGLTGLFAQAAAIPGDQHSTYFGSLPGSLVFVLAVSAFAAVVGFGVRLAARTTLPPPWRRPASAARWFLMAVSAAGILSAVAGLLGSAGSPAVPAGVVTAATGTVLLTILIALEFDFEHRKP